MSSDGHEEIRWFLEQVAQAGRISKGEAEYFQKVLGLVLQAMQAPAGLIWTVGAAGRVEPACHAGIEATGIAVGEDAQQAHNALVPVLLQNPGGLLVPPRAQLTGPDGGVLASNPTDLLVISAPFDRPDGRAGLIEVFHQPNEEQVQRGYLVFLGEIAAQITAFLGGRQLIAIQEQMSALSQVEGFSRKVHESLDPVATAFTLANEARLIIGCDRVSVLVKRRRKLRLEAVSGQESVERRASAVQRIEALVAVVARAGDSLWHPDPGRELPPQIERELEDYIDESHATALAVIPLEKPRPTPVVKPGGVDAVAVAKAEAAPRAAPEPVGALVAEWFQTATIDVGQRNRVDFVGQHGRVALANALAHTGLPLYPVLDVLGRSRTLTTARNLPRTVLAGLAALAAIAALVFVPAELRLEGKGTLEPVRRRDVFAGIDGVVKKVEPGIEHGAGVTAGQLLATLRNTELEVAVTDVVGRKDSANEQIIATERSLKNEKLTAAEKNRLYGELAKLRREFASLGEQERLYARKIADLEVRSPIDGVVTTWQVRERLQDRPVDKGQVMLTVADKTGPWELEVHMPDDRLGHVNRAAAAARAAGRELEVQYILATDPGTRHRGAVKEIHEQAEVRGEEGNTVLVRVQIDPERHEKEELGAGASVTARIACGRRPLGYVWFHDLLAFLRTQVLFRLW